MYDTSVGWNLVVDALKSLDQLVQAGELRRHLIEKNGGCHDTFRRYHGLYGVSAEKIFSSLQGKTRKDYEALETVIPTAVGKWLAVFFVFE